MLHKLSFSRLSFSTVYGARTVLVLILSVVFLAAVSGCASTSGGTDKPIKTDSQMVSLMHAGLLTAENGKPELGLKLKNMSEQPLWVLVHFQTPGGVGDCVLAQAVEGGQEHFFTCPQDSVTADVDYPVNIEVRKQAAQRDASEILNPTLKFSAEDVAYAGG